jgi:sterol desaturase/sphingolipid hydroxylase (fatty acid hydroxylase superfamily)
VSPGLVDAMSRAFGDVQQWLFESAVQPLMFHAGLGNLLAEGYRATGWLLVGLLQIAVMLTLFAALERWRPVEPVTDRAAVRVDVIYTLIHRLGLVRVLLFFSVDPLWDLVIGKLRLWGLPTWSLDNLWPGVTDVALVSFVLYLVLFDAVDYALHRAQHRVELVVAAARRAPQPAQMTMWSDNRNHLLDDLIRDSVFVGVALVVGIAPSQFVAMVALTQLVESLSHANVRLSFGPLLSRVLVGPQYHRCTTASAWGTNRPAPAAWAGTTSRCCSRSGTCSSAPHASTAATSRPASATSCPSDGGRDYGAASGPSSGWGCALAGRA